VKVEFLSKRKTLRSALDYWDSTAEKEEKKTHGRSVPLPPSAEPPSERESSPPSDEDDVIVHRFGCSGDEVGKRDEDDAREVNKEGGSQRSVLPFSLPLLSPRRPEEPT